MNYYDQEYFESIFTSFIEHGVVPPIGDTALITQAMATLRRAEYTSYLLDWFVYRLDREDYLQQNLKLAKEREFIQGLSSLLFLIGNNQEYYSEFCSARNLAKLQSLFDHLEIEIS